MLVVASMIVWGTPVTALQLFGFGIATAGLVQYTRLGQKAKEASRDTREGGPVRPQRLVPLLGTWPSCARLGAVRVSGLLAFVFVGLVLAPAAHGGAPPVMSSLPALGGAMPESRNAFATFLSATGSSAATPEKEEEDDADIYFVAARVLAYQLLHAPETRTTERTPFIVLVTPDVSQPKRDRLDGRRRDRGGGGEARLRLGQGAQRRAGPTSWPRCACSSWSSTSASCSSTRT